mgnify:CR=1 FL=1
MDRRRLLVAAAGLVAGCSSTPPQATGPRTPPTPSEPTESGDRSLRVADLAVEEADDGHLRVLATVRNPTDAELTRTLRIRVSVDESRTARRRSVTVAANGEREVAFDFETVGYDDFSGNGSLNPSWS